MSMPDHPKIYHICHVDRQPSIVATEGLLSDAVLMQAPLPGTVIGMSHIKQRRLTELRLNSHPQLFVGQCVPFYFCPRSVMLFLIHKRSTDLAYQGGQGAIIHLEVDLRAVVDWASGHGRRWAFTLSNAGARYFEDRAHWAQLGEVDWDAVQSMQWQTCKEGKQAEFLVEHSFPWHLVEKIGVQSVAVHGQVAHALPVLGHRPAVQIQPDWYY